MPHHFLTFFRKTPYIIRVFLIAIVLIIVFGVLITFIEPENFQTLFDGIWWAIVTISTVGYGDFVPETVLGKVLGVLLIFLGVGFVSTFLVSLAKATISTQNAMLEGKMMFKGKDHIVIIGWNERSKKIIEKLSYKNGNVHILLIDATLDKNPFPKGNIFFIKGNPTQDQVLLQGNITEAKKVLITADQSKDEIQADMHSIITLLAIKGLNQHVPCIVELLTKEQIENAKRAGADEILFSSGVTSSVMLNCLHCTGTLQSLSNFLEDFEGNRMNYQTAISYAGLKFAEANQKLLEKGYLLIGIKRGNETFINPTPSLSIKEKDILVVIVPEQDSSLV